VYKNVHHPSPRAEIQNTSGRRINQWKYDLGIQTELLKANNSHDRTQRK